MLPALATDGNRIIRRDTGAAVLLRGVNRSGLEYSEPANRDFLASARLTENEIRHITRDWGANIIRLPFNQDWALNGRSKASPEDYLRALDQAIAWAAQNGAYTLLDLQWLSAEDEYGRSSEGSPIRIAPLPNNDSQVLWRILAERYRDQPSVLFDLYNEPHDVSVDLWRMWADILLGVVRERHPESLVFLSGTDWGYDLRDVQIHETNVVYSTHVYPWKELAWDKAFGFLTDDLPVFAGEWGGNDEHLSWGEDLAGYLRDRSLGWTAWSWSDWPHLVSRNEPENWVETRFGELVRRQLQSPLILPSD